MTVAERPIPTYDDMGDLEFISPDKGACAAGCADEALGAAKVREFCLTWERAVKTICLYPATNPLPDEFRQKFFDSLTDLLDQQGRVALTVTDTALSFERTIVYERTSADENLAYLLFRDGICQIAFEIGVERGECDRFLAALADALSAPNDQIDVANRLWQEALPHIRHYTLDRVVEGTYIDIADDGQIEARHHQFLGASRPVPSPTLELGVAGAEAATPYRGVQQTRFSHVSKVFGDVSRLTTAEQSQLVALIRPEPDHVAEQLGVGILFEILRTAESPTLVEEAIAVTEKQFQSSVQANRWDMAKLILENWWANAPVAPTSISRQLKAALVRAADRHHFETLAQYLNSNPQSDLGEVRALLELFGTFAITPITAMLGILEHRPARMMVCDFLAEHGRDAIDLIGGFVYDKRWYVVRNVAKVLGDIGSERAVSFLRKSARHSDVRVRLETLRALQRIPGREAQGLLLDYLKDPQKELRMRALRAIGYAGAPTAVSGLRAQIEAGAAPNRDPDEMRELFTAYARVAGAAAVKHLTRLAKPMTWLRRRRLSVQVAAVQALAACPDPAARTELVALSRSRNRQIAQAAREAERRWSQTYTKNNSQPEDLEDSNNEALNISRSASPGN